MLSVYEVADCEMIVASKESKWRIQDGERSAIYEAFYFVFGNWIF